MPSMVFQGRVLQLRLLCSQTEIGFAQADCQPFLTSKQRTPRCKCEERQATHRAATQGSKKGLTPCAMRRSARLPSIEGNAWRPQGTAPYLTNDWRAHRLGSKAHCPNRTRRRRAMSILLKHPVPRHDNKRLMARHGNH